MPFIGKQGRTGFMAGNAFVKSAMLGTKAFMHSLAHHEAGHHDFLDDPSAPFVSLDGWEAFGSANFAFDGGIKFSFADAGDPRQGIRTTKTYTFNPKFAYRITAEIKPLDDMSDGGILQMPVTIDPHIDGTIGWGLAGFNGSDLKLDKPRQVLVIPEGHVKDGIIEFEIIDMASPIILVSLKIVQVPHHESTP